jgi:hypothetical protein
MEKKEKRKSTVLICLISQCLWVYNIFYCSIVCADIKIVWFADLKLQNAIAVLATGHPQVWLHVTLLIPRHVFGPIFVCFAHSLMPVLPQLDLQLLVALLPLGEYDDQFLIFCEAFFG